MTSKTTTKTASPRTNTKNSRKHSVKQHSVKKANRINRQRRLQKQLQILLLERHSRRCIICHHPEREAIEEEFVHWRAPWRLAKDYNLADYRTIYRHARAVGLLLQRRERLHSALDAFVESVDDVTFTGDTILRAVRAYSCIDAHGRWTEIPTQMQISTSHDAPSPQSSSPSSNARSSSPCTNVIDINPDEESEEDKENALRERVAALSRSSKSMSRRDNTVRAASRARAFHASEDEYDDLDDDDPDTDDDPDDDPDNDAPKNKSEVDSLKETTACAVSPAQALPRDVGRGQNPNDRSLSDRTDCAASSAQPSSRPEQPAAPAKPKPDADGIIWHPHPGYPNQEMSEPDAQGRVMYKIHITPPASQLPPRRTDSQRAADLIYRSVIKKYGNP